MKMRKLLSGSALTLGIICFTSVGASAATIPENADLIKILANQYNNGTNSFGVLSGVNKDTTLGSVINTNVTTEMEKQLSNHPFVTTLLKKIDNNKANTIATVLRKIDKDNFNQFKTKFIDVLGKVQAMDSKEGKERIDAENKLIIFVKAFDNTLDVTIGKDYEGKTTALITKNGQALIQINADNVQTIKGRVSDLKWGDIAFAKTFLK